MITKPDDTDDLRHIDDLPEYNADPGWAVDDDGELYWVDTGDYFPRTGWTHERYVLDKESRLARDGCGDPCETCGHEIGPKAIILKDTDGDYHHLGCYLREN